MSRFRQIFILDGEKDHVQIELLSDANGKNSNSPQTDEDVVETTTMYYPIGKTQNDPYHLHESINLVNFTGTLLMVRSSIVTDSTSPRSDKPKSVLSRFNRDGNNVNSGIKSIPSWKVEESPKTYDEKITTHRDGIISSPGSLRKTNSPRSLLDNTGRSTKASVSWSNQLASKEIITNQESNNNNDNNYNNKSKQYVMPKHHLGRQRSAILQLEGLKPHVPNDVRTNRATERLQNMENIVEFSNNGKENDNETQLIQNFPRKKAEDDDELSFMSTTVFGGNFNPNQHGFSKKSFTKSVHTSGEEGFDISNMLLDSHNKSPVVDSKIPKLLLFPTELHVLCAEPKVTLTELEHVLIKSDPTVVSTTDNFGRLPLHILGDNDELVSTPEGKMVASTFAFHLMRLHPAGITSHDERGRMPFVTLIEDWCTWVYKSHKENAKNRRTAEAASSTFANRIMDRITNNTTEWLDNENTTTKNASDTKLNIVVGSDHSSHHSMTTKAFPKVELWDEVEWCFTMLSTAMDELGGKNGSTSDDYEETSSKTVSSSSIKTTTAIDHRGILAKHILSVVPNLVKTILLINQDGGQVRERLLHMSLFRRLLLCPESVGPWLTMMLRRKGIPSKRAVDYLVLVSKLTVTDHVGGFRTILDNDFRIYTTDKNRVFYEIEKLGGTIASLVVLDKRDVQRASNTTVAWHIMSKNLARPFLVGIVMMDFVLHVTLMLAFRTDTKVVIDGSDDSESVLANFGSVPTQVVLFICSHYIIRKACEAISLLAFSVGVFRGYFTSMWTLLDIFTIVVTLVAIIWNNRNPNDYRGGLNAFVTGLLWLKVLSFLKVINKQMATFIMSLTVILQDLRYFFIVIVVIIFMFGDMMTIVVTSYDNGLFCAENDDGEGALSSFCSSQRTQAYLRVYSLLLGDFELDDYRQTPGTTTLFVLFTMMGVVILLNVLIALVSDSYEVSRMRSGALFGMARVSFIAQHEALEQFLRPGTGQLVVTKVFESRIRFVSFFSRLFKWVVLLSLLATAMHSQIFLLQRAAMIVKEREDWLTLGLVSFLCISLAVSLWMVSSFALEGSIPSFEASAINNGTKALAKVLSVVLFGSIDDMRGDDVDEWTGRIQYLERSMERSQQQTKKDIAAEISALEKRIFEHQAMLADDQ